MYIENHPFSQIKKMYIKNFLFSASLHFFFSKKDYKVYDSFFLVSNSDSVPPQTMSAS